MQLNLFNNSSSLIAENKNERINISKILSRNETNKNIEENFDVSTVQGRLSGAKVRFMLIIYTCAYSYFILKIFFELGSFKCHKPNSPCDLVRYRTINSRYDLN